MRRAAQPAPMLGAVPAVLLALVAPGAVRAQEPVAGSEPVPSGPPGADRSAQAAVPRPLGQWPLLAPEPAFAVRWVDDVLALRALWRELGAAGSPPPVDFGRGAVLLVARPLAAGDHLHWRDARQEDGAFVARLEPRAGAAPGAPPPAREDGSAAPGRPTGALFLLPRPPLPLRLEWPAAGNWTPLATVPPPVAPADAVLLPVLAARELADTGLACLRCERATTPAEWRELRAALGTPAGLPGEDFADFGRECVVVLATGRARAFPGLHVAAATEEGVDVLTVTERSPSGVLVAERAPALVLKLPRRGRALAVVLRRACGPAPGTEETVSVLPALR